MTIISHILVSCLFKLVLSTRCMVNIYIYIYIYIYIIHVSIQIKSIYIYII
ncbi:MAG: hypothetical protein MCS20_01865 [Candidatus Phytoplasma mali]|nr:hypothetical protein [Candidatus Phytoplasma mali]